MIDASRQFQYYRRSVAPFVFGIAIALSPDALNAQNTINASFFDKPDKPKQRFVFNTEEIVLQGAKTSIPASSNNNGENAGDLTTPDSNTAIDRFVFTTQSVSLVGTRSAQPEGFSVTAKEALTATGTRAEYPTHFSVTVENPLTATGTKAEYPTHFSVTANSALTATGTKTDYPTHFSVTAKNPLTATGTKAEYPTHFSVTANGALTATGTKTDYPTHFSVTAKNPLTATGTKAEYPTHFSVTANGALTATGTKTDYPSHFSVTAKNPLTATGTRAEYPTHFSVTANEALTVTGGDQEVPPPPIGESKNGADSSNLTFVPLVSLVQVTPLEYRGELVQPFEPDTVVAQIDDRIAERRDAVINGTTAPDTGDSGGNGNSGGGFTAESMAVNGPLPISSTDGQINLDYNPSPAMRSLRLFNEDSTSPMPIRRVLTTSGVSAGAVQINIDDDFFAVHSRVPMSDVVSAPGGQTIIVRDFSDNSYLQIQITVGAANFFGDHTVENVVGWYCGTDPADCPL